MLDKDVTTVTKHLHEVVDSEFISLRSFIDLLLQDQDEDHRMFADVLDALYWHSMSRMESEFKQIEKKTGTIEATYTTVYHPDKGAGLFLDARFIPLGKADHSALTAKDNSRPDPDEIPDSNISFLWTALKKQMGRATPRLKELIDQGDELLQELGLIPGKEAANEK